MLLWNEPLSDEQKQTLIEDVASKVVEKGMTVPAVMFLEMHKPVSFIASQGALVFSPFLGAVFGIGKVDQYSQLFADRDNIEQLIQRIEELSIEQERLKKEEKNAARK